MTHGLHPHLWGETTPPGVTSLSHGMVWSNRNFFVLSWHDTLHRCLYRFDPPLYTGPRSGQQHNNSQYPGSQMLLVAQILVRRYEKVVAFVFCDVK